MILTPLRQIPRDLRDWDHVFLNLNRMLKVLGGQYQILSDATLDTRTSTDLDALVSYLTDAGRATSQRFLPQVSAGNKLSAQSTAALSATSTSTSTINIASHSVQYGFGQVAFNSGSITGLTTSTLYYVYASDPNYSGGAVTYQATTNPLTVVSNDAYYYLGSITTPVSTSSGNISAATSANPIEFTTSANHGWSSGNTVEFASLPGDFGTNLNGTQKVITVTAVNKFTIAIDGSAYAAYTSGGTATRVSSGSSGGYGGGGGGPTGPIP